MPTQPAKLASRAATIAAVLAVAACNRSTSSSTAEAQPPTVTGANQPAPISMACASNFAAFDGNGDHRVSLEEFQSKPHASPDPTSVFRARDRNGDGYLSEAEFCAAWPPGARPYGRHGPGPGPGPAFGPGGGPGMGPQGMGPRGPGHGMGVRCEENFARFDTNHDGTVSEEELAAWPHVHGDAAAIFAARDHNHDGVITKDEFCAPWRTK